LNQRNWLKGKKEEKKRKLSLIETTCAPNRYLWIHFAI
jgi:hypothetical protein